MNLALNIGSGGNERGVLSTRQIHIDVAIRRIMGIENSVLGDVNHLPISSGVADLVVCVGGALNYADPYKAIWEVCRSTRKGGHIILEFESSKSLEFNWRNTFGREIVTVDTFYNGRVETIQVYSESLISRLLSQSGARIKIKRSFHVLSSLALRFSKDESTAQRWARFDGLARFIPVLRNCGSNVILLAKKVGGQGDSNYYSERPPCRDGEALVVR